MKETNEWKVMALVLKGDKQSCKDEDGSLSRTISHQDNMHMTRVGAAKDCAH